MFTICDFRYWMFDHRGLVRFFKSNIEKQISNISNGRVAQSAEAPHSECGGWGCESLRGYHLGDLRSLLFDVRFPGGRVVRRISNIEYPTSNIAIARVAQSAEAADLKSAQSGFESRHQHQPGRIPQGWRQARLRRHVAKLSGSWARVPEDLDKVGHRKAQDGIPLAEKRFGTAIPGEPGCAGYGSSASGARSRARK